MATFLKLKNGNWRAQINKDGQRPAKTFATKAEAQQWANAMEVEIVSGKRGLIPNKTFADLLDRYIEEVSRNKKTHDYEVVKIVSLSSRGDPLATTKLANLDSVAVASWRDRRRKEVSDATVRREWNLFSHACTIARKEWKWLRDNPFSEVSRPAPTAARTRTFTDAEVAAILLCAGTDMTTVPTTKSGVVGLALKFALETAMRSGEICALKWKDIDGKTAVVRGEDIGAGKSGRRVVPLSSEARRILQLLPSANLPDDQDDDENSVFDLTTKDVDALFRKIRTKAGVPDVHFHDARATALTRLSKIFTNPLELAKISGHRDLKMLLNVYYRPDVSTFADRMG